MMRLFFIILILISFWIKVLHLRDRSLTWDEMETFLEVNGIGYKVSFDPYSGFSSGDFQLEKTFKNSLRALIERDSGNGIVYISTLYFWMKLWGNSNVALRSLSILFSGLAVLMTYFLALELFEDKNIGFWSAIVLSFHELAVQYSQEARAYSMAVFFCVTSIWLFIKILNNRHPHNFILFIAFSFSSSMAILSHYFSAFIILALVIVAFLYVRDFYSWKNLIISGAFVLIVISLWLYSGGFEGFKFMGIRNENYKHLSLIDPSNSFYGKVSHTKVIGGSLQMLTHSFGIGFQRVGMQVRYASIFLLLPIILLYLNKFEIIRNKKSIVILTILCLVIPLAAIFLALKSGHIVSFQTLYLNFAIPFSCLIIGFLIHSSLIKQSATAIWLALMFCSVLLSSNYSNLHLTRDQVQAEKYLNIGKKIANSAPTDTVVFKSLEKAFYINLYLTNKNILQKVDSTSGSAIDFE